MFYFWLVIIVLGLIAELIKPMYLFGACFSLAGIIPFFMSISSIDSPWYIVFQILIFVIIALLLIFLLRKKVVSWLENYSKKLSVIDSIGVLQKDEDTYFCVIEDNRCEILYVPDIESLLGKNVKIIGIKNGKYKIEQIDDNSANETPEKSEENKTTQNDDLKNEDIKTNRDNENR